MDLDSAPSGDDARQYATDVPADDSSATQPREELS
jgi:hypothetical protein